MRPQIKKLIFFVIPIAFLIGGFFIFASSARAVDPAPAAAAPAAAAPAAPVDAAKARLDAQKSTDGSATTKPTVDATDEEASTGFASSGASAAARPKTTQPAQKDMYIPVVFHTIGIALYLVMAFLSHVVALAAKIANLVLSINQFTTVPVVQYGWEITRGLCNMLFALVLLMLAFDTVLQTEYMGTKRTLVRLIVVALLINFSLMFGGVIIDFCQVLTFYFIKAAAGDGNSWDVALKLAGGMKISKIWDSQPAASVLSNILYGPSLSTIITMLMCDIILVVTVFTFFAFSFFLLVRVVWLWLLLIIAPLAWASYVAPPDLTSSFGGGFQAWWKEFLKWSFFAPAYAFFLYLAMTIAQDGLSLKLKNTALEDNYISAGFFQSLDLVLQYIVVVMILLAGLKLAQKTGVYGANAVLSTVDKMGNTVGNWSKRQAKRPFYAAYDKSYAGATSLLGKGISKIGFKNAGNLLAAKSRQIKTASADREHNKAFKSLLPHLSRDAILGLLAKASGARALELAKIAKSRGDLTKYYGDENDPAQLAKDPNIKQKNDTSREAALKARKTFRDFEMHGEADALEETRLDIAETKDVKDRIKDGIANGNFAKNKAGSFRGDNCQAIVEAIGKLEEKDEIPRTEIVIAHKKLNKEAQDTFNNTAKMAIMADQTAEQKGLRRIYAGTNSDINGAFKDHPELEKEYCQTMEPKEIGSLSTKTELGKASLETLGRYITEGQMSGIRGEMNGLQKTIMMQGAINAGRRNELMANSPPWAMSVIRAIEKTGKQQASAVAGLSSKIQASAAAPAAGQPGPARTQSSGPSAAASTDEAAPI